MSDIIEKSFTVSIEVAGVATEESMRKLIIEKLLGGITSDGGFVVKVTVLKD